MAIAGALLADKTEINVAQLQRVDSAGLALLVNLRAHQRGVELKISGATDRLRTLVALYNLQTIMPVDAGSQHFRCFNTINLHQASVEQGFFYRAYPRRRTLLQPV